MKIYERQELILNQTEKKDRKDISEKNNFKNIIEGIYSASVARETSTPADNVQMPVIGGVEIISKEEPITNDKEEILKGLEDTLDLVDFYADKLADSSLSAENLSPLVEQLEQRLDILKDMESSGEMNERLKTIISDVTTTMGMEIEKFRRGDYI